MSNDSNDSTRDRQSYLLSRVNARAQQLILSSEEGRRRFQPGSHCQAFVLAADIRRSTELMLKARSAEAFAGFISTLGEELAAVIKGQCGVFDKFTGDGVLAYFPDFLCGNHTARNAVQAAAECHQLWDRHYRAHRSSFSTVLMDVGLGIGLDFGLVHTVAITDDVTVVGEPVVYACRLSGGGAGQTLANQPAAEQIEAQLAGRVSLEETQIEVKHEGATLAYRVKPAAG